MISPARIAASITGGVGAVAGIGTAIGWLHSHVSSDVVYLVALALFVGAMGIVLRTALRSFPGIRTVRNWGLVVLAQILAIPIAWGVVSSLTSGRTTEYVMGYVLVTLAIVPTLWLLYRLDEASHKQCEMCCERIKEPARVCPFCTSPQPVE
jgi:hypothetical protein